MIIIKNLLILLVGALLGNLFSGPTDQFVGFVAELYCQSAKLISEGKALRLIAIEKNMSDVHAAANQKFAQSSACNPEGMAYLGQAYCYGWGVPLDRRRGLQMIRSALRRDSRLTAEWLGNQHVCPDI